MGLRRVILSSALFWTVGIGQLQQQFQQFNQQPFQFQPQQQQFQQFQQFPQNQFPMGFDQEVMDLIEMNQNPDDPRHWRDRRASEGWYGMFPFGEIHHDIELLNQPNLDRQIDLDFYYPFYGFRYNYTFIIPDGLLAFSRPEYIQPPFTFPNPKWPNKRDASFIAPFYADATYQYVGDVGISHVWYRSIHREKPEDINRAAQSTGQTLFGGQTNPGRKVQAGYVEDDRLLDNITQAIQEGIIGAGGFTASDALIVTWERMAYGGSPKSVEVHMFHEFKKWQNTYQLILATDEIRSYAMFNYANINWTSSNEAGALTGRGGKQSAMAGFNGGNGTGWTPLPFSGEGEMYKLARFTSSVVPGRWVYRVDEEIIPGGCSNDSIGAMTTSPTETSMMGGMVVNVSGPCIRPGDSVVVLFDEFTVSCKEVNMGRAMCILPRFHKVGLIACKISHDGGMSFPFVGTFYIIHPDRSMPYVSLSKDVVDKDNNWDSHKATLLWLSWGNNNLTWNTNHKVNIDLIGYWEDTEKSTWEKVGILAENHPNTGFYSFKPQTFARIDRANLRNMWKWYEFGAIRISVPDDPSCGVHYSPFVPFSWYFVSDWRRNYGSDWPIDRCIEWFEYDGNQRNFFMDLEPCPCVLDQALMDLGRFMPYYWCDKDGDSSCPMHRGAQHCVMSVQPSWTGAQQVCCYDFEGWLMMSDDYENPDHLKYYSPGTPHRAHTMGSYPYKVPPLIPTLSNMRNDVLPYQMCCKYAEHCEFYFWRRQTNSCMDYKPPVAAYAYGEPHFITFDGMQYTFNGKGYYVLLMSDHPQHRLMIQARMEQPPKTIWNRYPNATVITAIAVQENDSDVIQLSARKDFRRWRYKMDIQINGGFRMTDSPEMKWQHFNGFSFFSPAQNMDASELYIQLKSGAGVRVAESHGVLDVAVFLPPSFNETYKYPHRGTFERTAGIQDRFRTYGLMGTYNSNPLDDLMLPDGSMAPTTSQFATNDAESRVIYYNFGEKWKVDGTNPNIGSPLFFDNTKPIYNPLLFSSSDYVPKFDAREVEPDSRLVFRMDEVKAACQDNWACKYDYIRTGVKEIALHTLAAESWFLSLKSKGSKHLVSCGSLLKAYGALKVPHGNNYLDGVTVTFTCRPDYFLHGDAQRTCMNGTWTPGWHVWCRGRTEEIALKWFMGIIVSLLILGLIVGILLYCFCIYVRPYRQKEAKSTKLTREERKFVAGRMDGSPQRNKPITIHMKQPKEQLTIANIPVPELDFEPGSRRI